MSPTATPTPAPPAIRDQGKQGVNEVAPPVASTIEVSSNTVKQPDKWNELFDSSKFGTKGMKLGFIAPMIKDGTSIAQLQQSKIDAMTINWKSAVVMYVVGDTPTITALSQFVSKDWNHLQKPLIYKHTEGYFVVKFASEADRDEVLCAGPHSFRGKPIVIKPWNPNFDFHQEVLRVIPLWVKLQNLPLSCWSSDSLSRIGSLLGVPLWADTCTSKQLRVSFARLLIEVDVTVPLPESISVAAPNGQVFY